MAVTACNEILGARSSGIDAQWRRTYRRAWRVETDSPFTGSYEARTSIPVFPGNYYVQTDGAGTVTEFDTFSFASKIEASIDPECDDDCAWIVTVDYGPYDPTTFPENPLQHPLKISFGSGRFERVVDQDINGNAVSNSAGDYFDPPPTIDDSRPTIRVVRNEQTYNPQYAISWKDTVNTDTFFGFGPGQVKLAQPLGELEYSPVIGFYVVVTYEFEINPAGWKKEILDQGLRKLGGGGQVACVDENGQPVTSPVLLDGAGGQLATGGDPAFMEFEVYQKAAFSGLALDPSAAPGQ
jgi:hypothetical protein